MKKQILTLTLALSLALLAACGGGGSSSGNTSGSGSQPDTSVTEPDQSTPDGSGDSSTPDASEPDSSAPDASQPVEDEPQAEASLSLSKSDFTLFTAGATWQLKASATPAGGALTWSSSDEEVATVSDNGTVTAVAPGTATITVKDASTGLTASCTVRCNWEEKAPDNGGSSSSGGSSSGDTSTGGSSSNTGSVDLQAFFDTINTDYEMPFMMEMDSAALDSYFPGLTGLSTQQLVAYSCALNPSPAGDVVLVQLANSSDVSTVKALFQDRIDYMTGADGNMPGAWYPGPTEMWLNSSRIVSNGNYVMLVVNENCDAIVDAFNALF